MLSPDLIVVVGGLVIVLLFGALAIAIGFEE